RISDLCLFPSSLSSFFSLLPRPPHSTLFPYTTLFRSAPPRLAWPHVRQGTGDVEPGARSRAYPLPVEARWTARLRQMEASLVGGDRKSTRLNSSHLGISYAVFCLKKKKKKHKIRRQIV